MQKIIQGYCERLEDERRYLKFRKAYVGDSKKAVWYGARIKSIDWQINGLRKWLDSQKGEL